MVAEPPESGVGRFEILGVLGCGAHGVVVLARDRADASSELVGLKVLRSPDPTMRERIRSEARILAWLRHPSIARVHRLLEKDGHPIVVMEYVEGASVAELLRGDREGLPAAVAVEIAHRVAVALRAGWESVGSDGQPMRVVHRDIKPGNLLLSVHGELKVVDFGIATWNSDDDPEITESRFLGTRGFIAPERGRGGPETPAVDAWALGATLYALLTGNALVPRGARHESTIAPALQRLAPAGIGLGARSALRALIADLCCPRPEGRPVHGALVRRIEAVRALIGRADLAGWADARVVPLARARILAPEDHPAWPDLAFLAGGGPVVDLAVPTPEPPRDLALRPARDPAELATLLADLRPRWFVARAAEPDRLVSALLGLRGTRHPRAVARAHELTRHPDPRVREAAWDLLAEAC